jgi:TRAP-type C4-dicarboxylate transport system permease large subunit
MPRPKLALIWILRDALAELFVTFNRQKIRVAFLLALLIFVIAMVFSFLAFSPILSPFVYPLF